MWTRLGALARIAIRLGAAVSCSAWLCVSSAAAQVTAPVLAEGSTFVFAPPDGVAAEAAGQVLVELLIDADGTVQDARVVETDSELDSVRDAAIAHARALRFAPALRDGRAVAARTRVRLQLRAAEASDATAPAAASGGHASVGADARAASDITTGVAASGAHASVGADARAASDITTGAAASGAQARSGDGGGAGAAGQVAGNASPAAPSRARPPRSAADGRGAGAVGQAAAELNGVRAGAADGGKIGVGQKTDDASTAARASDDAPMSQSTLAADGGDVRSEFGARAKLHAGVGAASAVAASDMDIEPGALAQVPRLDTQSYLTLSPGIVLANHSGIGHVSSVYLRGFDAGEGQDLEVRVDDVPINEPSNAHEHGYADTAFVIPETVERLRVQQGAFDPRQGDFAVAGSVAYTLGVKERGLRAQLGYGSFNEQRGLVLWAPQNASQGTFTALDLRRGDGFGPERAHQSVSALARYAGASGPLHYSLLLGSHAQQFDSAGVVRQDAVTARELSCAKDARSQFFCAQDASQGGSGHRHLLRAALSWARPGRRYQLLAYGMIRGLRIRENFTGALQDVRGDGQDEGYKATTVGMQTSYVLTPRWWTQKQRLELGLSARHDDAETSMWRLRSNTAVPYATVFDTQLALTHIAGYLRAELSPLPWLSLRGGVRVDSFGFSSEDLNAPSSDRVGPRLPRDARDAWGTAVSPRAALVLTPAPGFNWSFSAGQGVRSSDAQALSEGERAPFARVLALETGPSWDLRRGPLHLSAHGFAFATRVSNDMLFDPVRGRNVPVGPSNRYGASISARARIGQQHDTLASFTWSDARAIERSDGIFALGQGEALAYVPRSVLRVDHASGATVSVAGEPLRLMLAAGLGWVGPMPLPLGAASYARWQLDASARVGVRAVELGLSAINLFDVRNRATELFYASSFGADGASSMMAARHFAAGAPRSFWLTLTVFLDDLELG